MVVLTGFRYRLAQRLFRLSGRTLSERSGQAASEDEAVSLRGGGLERIAVEVKAFELARQLNPVGDGVARHQAAGPLGMEADDLVDAVFPVFEHTFDHPGLEHFLLHGLEILL